MKYILRYLLIVILFISKTYFTYASSFEDGVQFYKNNRYGEAIEKFKIAIKDGSGDKIDIHILLGNCYVKLNMLKEAASEYKIALKGNPRREEIYYNLCGAYFLLKETKRAINLSEKAIKMFPSEESKYRHFLGMLYSSTEIKKQKEAKQQFYKSIELFPQNYLAHYELGSIFVEEENYKEAFIEYKKAIEIKPDFIQAYKDIVVLPNDSGPIDEQIKLLEYLLEKEPNNYWAKLKYNQLKKLQSKETGNS